MIDLTKARSVDIDLLAATDWSELRSVYSAALDEIDRLRDCLIEERASKKISLFCNCERCWPPGTPKSPSRIAAEEKVRQEARQQLEAEGKL